MVIVPMVLGILCLAFGAFALVCELFINPHTGPLFIPGVFLGLGSVIVGSTIGMMGRMIPALVLTLGGLWLGFHIGT